MKIIGIITSFTILTFLSAIWSGFVLCKLWAWFIIPTFGLPALSVGVAIGIALLINYLTAQPLSNSKQDNGKSASEKLWEAILVPLLRPAISLLFGWIVTLFLA